VQQESLEEPRCFAPQQAIRGNDKRSEVIALLYAGSQVLLLLFLFVLGQDFVRVSRAVGFHICLDPDVMYMHQAIKEPDREKFIEGMQKEVRDQSKNGNFLVIHRSKVSKGAMTLPSVWQMKQKRNIQTQQAKK
jgi:hypothetical protein